MTSLWEENEQAHREILSAIKFSYAELDSENPSARRRRSYLNGPAGAAGGAAVNRSRTMSDGKTSPLTRFGLAAEWYAQACWAFDKADIGGRHEWNSRSR